MPCDPGFVRCSEHRQYSDRRALAAKLTIAQDRVLNRVEEALDEAINELIRLSVSAAREGDRLMATNMLLKLGGFEKLVIEGEAGVKIDPEERDQLLMRIFRKHVDDEQKQAELARKVALVNDADIIDAEIVDDDSSG